MIAIRQHMPKKKKNPDSMCMEVSIFFYYVKPLEYIHVYTQKTLLLWTSSSYCAALKKVPSTTGKVMYTQAR